MGITVKFIMIVGAVIVVWGSALESGWGSEATVAAIVALWAAILDYRRGRSSAKVMVTADTSETQPRNTESG
jgi:hypothetical protein